MLGRVQVEQSVWGSLCWRMWAAGQGRGPEAGWAVCLQKQPAVRHHVSEEAQLRPEGAGEEAGGEPARDQG